MAVWRKPRRSNPPPITTPVLASANRGRYSAARIPSWLTEPAALRHHADRRIRRVQSGRGRGDGMAARSPLCARRDRARR